MTINPFAGDRITLTTFRDDDLTQFAHWLSNFDLQRMVNPGMNAPFNPDDLNDPNGWFQQGLKSEESRTFAVRTHDNDTFIGVCALINVDRFSHHAEIGINIADPDYQGKGYGGEIMRLLMRYGFEQFNLHRIYLRVMSYNTRGIRLYEKLGFLHEVKQREAIFRDGTYHDGLIMGILRSEWEQAHD